MKYYVTTAIDYANAAPHIGHAYEKIAADIVSRYQRLLGKDVFYMTGTDEHGIKVEKAAEAAGKSAQLFVDEISDKFKAAWSCLDINYDYFIRTTETRHKEVVQRIFSKMKAKGDVYKGSYEGLYCEGCEDFVRERDLQNGKCGNHLKEPKKVVEQNYFFRLTKYKEQIKEWLLDKEHVKPDGRRLEVINQLDDPELGDFSITRSRSSLTWGIPVPDEPDQVIYVWIDALSNYITGAGYLTDEARFQKWWPADLHVIGKDITKFHAIYWPAVLLSIEVPLPKMIFGHGFITVEGQKMSKSLGNVLDPVYLAGTYGADAVRYFLFEANTFDQDGDFSRVDMIKKVNSHLAGGLGNLLNRALTLIDRNYQGVVPDLTSSPELIAGMEEASKLYHQYMSEFEFSKAIKAVFEGIVDPANKFMSSEKPWDLFKSGKQDEGGIVLVTVLNMLKRSALLMQPITPKLSQDIWAQLGYSEPPLAVHTESKEYLEPVPSGQKLNNKGPVFKQIEEPKEEVPDSSRQPGKEA